MDRRTFLTATGVATLSVTAGCLGSDPTDDPEDVVVEYYELSDEIESPDDFDDFLDDAEDILHSASPIPDFFEEDDEGEGEFEEVTLESIETEIVAEDVDEDALTEEYGLGFFVDDEDDIEAIAEENAIVEATLELSNGEEMDGEGEPAEHVVATEDGDWLLVA